MYRGESADGLRYIDLFCGIGGFRLAMEQACSERGLSSSCVLSSDIDPDAQAAYAANFGETPMGDIREIAAKDVPPHDILFAGFPCQPFSICGDMKGFEDLRGTLFFEIARLLEARRPTAFVLENVKMLRGHDGGRTLRRIMATLADLGYHADCRVLNAIDFGVPQNRERVFIVGFDQPTYFAWPMGGAPMRSLSEVLECDIPDFYMASERIRAARAEAMNGSIVPHPSIWHENKGGHISAYPFSCAQRAGASYNYLLVDGVRRLTEREMLRLNGFPDTFRIVCGYGATRKQAGNSVAVPCVAAVIGAALDAMGTELPATGGSQKVIQQGTFVFERDRSEPEERVR